MEAPSLSVMEPQTMKYAQRWIETQARWVPERHVVDTSGLEVELVEESVAKHFILTHHYSGSYPAARLRVGLYERGELVGVAVYSEPANVGAVGAWTQDAYARHEGVELSALRPARRGRLQRRVVLLGARAAPAA